MTPVVFLDPAEEEMIEAALYYEDQAVGLGEHFVAEVQHAVQPIAEHPTSSKIIKGAVRRRLLRRFPFGILYRIEKEEIVIVAVMHLRRRPGYWSDRT
jgi:toxin ParE1/3/4